MLIQHARKKTLIVLLLSTTIAACGGGSDSSSDDGGGTPQLSNTTPTTDAGSDQTVEEQENVTLSGSGTDSDGSISSYIWTQTSGTSVTLTDANSATATFVAPDIAKDETLTFQLTVTDNDNATATDSVDIFVQNLNQLPTANAGRDQTIEEQASITLSGSGTDGSISSYSWTQTSGTPVTLTDATSATATFVAPEIAADETLTFQLTVKDVQGNSSEDYVDVKVNNFYDKNIILRVVRVTEDWMPYASTGGWTNAVQAGNKESESVKYYEVAIWEETDSIHLYAFDNEFDPLYGLAQGVTDEQKIAYRESYRLMRLDGLPEVSLYQERSEFLRDSFIDISNYIANQYPDADHHLMYSGHGGPGGQLFAGHLNFYDAALFLESWSLSLGRNLGVVDMGGPCNKGSLADVKNFCQYADYYIASDLPNGGYTFDEWTIEKYKETQPEHQYHELFANSSNLKEVLIKRIDLKRKAYEYSVNNMIENKVEQGNYLYSCSSYEKFHCSF